MFYFPHETNLSVSVGLNFIVNILKSLICLANKTGLLVIYISLISKTNIACLLYESRPTIAKCFLWLNLICCTFSYGHWKLLIHLLSIQIFTPDLDPSWTVAIQS